MSPSPSPIPSAESPNPGFVKGIITSIQEKNENQSHKAREKLKDSGNGKESAAEDSGYVKVKAVRMGTGDFGGGKDDGEAEGWVSVRRLKGMGKDSDVSGGSKRGGGGGGGLEKAGDSSSGGGEGEKGEKLENEGLGDLWVEV